MKQKRIHRLFSLLLALVMLMALAVPGFADEGGGDPVRELRMLWLDWDEDGRNFASDDLLAAADRGEAPNGCGLAPSDEPPVIFFIWNNRTQKREKFVVPQAGDGIQVTRLASDEISSGAKQSQYYVRLRLEGWQDAVLTADGLDFHVSASMNDFWFFSSQNFSQETYLGNEVNEETLSGGILYFGNAYDNADEHDMVVSVEKNENGHENFYTVEKVNDGCWKIVYKDIFAVHGDIWVDLKLEVRQPDGETRQDGRSLRIFHDDGPQLQFVWLDSEWTEEDGERFYFDPDHRDVWSSGFDLQPGTTICGILGYGGEWDENGFILDGFTPVSVDELTLPAGVTANTDLPTVDGAQWTEYYVELSVTQADKEFTITWGDYQLTFNSRLPADIGVYTAPTASWDTWAGPHGFPYNMVLDNVYYLISTATDTQNGRHLTGLALSADWDRENEEIANDEVELNRVSDGVYELILKDGALNRDYFHLELDLTWTDIAGNSWTDRNRYVGNFDYMGAAVASETPLGMETGAFIPASKAAGKVANTVTIKAGEEKTIYLYRSAYSRSNGPIVGSLPLPGYFHSADDALTLVQDGADLSKFTLSSDKAGVYEIYIGFGVDLKLFHAGGTPYTDEEMAEFEETVFWDIDPDTMGLTVCDDMDAEDPEFVPFEEMFPGESYEMSFLDTDWGQTRITVTVEPDYTDVATGDWFYDDVVFVSVNGMMNGTTANTFSPSGAVKREMVPTVLYRLEGEPAVSAGSFTDVPAGTWYTNAAAWSAENDIVKGLGNGAFGVGTDITREQLAVMLYRYAQYKGCDVSAAGDLSSFPDAGSIHSWALTEMQWAVGAGILNGKGGSLVPQGSASRAELAAMLARFSREVLN